MITIRIVLISLWWLYFPGNKPHPAAKEPTLPANDPRLKYVMKKFDPRIHFALNCGAKVTYIAAN